MPEQTKSRKSDIENVYLQAKTAADKRQIVFLDEKSEIYVIKLWDGIFLWGNDIHSGHIAYPNMEPEQTDFVVINICHTGRCEVEMLDDTYIYMTPGLLNVNQRVPKGGYHYPGARYEGIEIAFDMEMLKKCMPAELDSYGITMEVLEDILRAGDGNYMANASEAAMQKSKALYERLKTGDLMLPDYRFQTLSLLYSLKNGEAEKSKTQSLVTKGQRRIAVEAEQLLTQDLRKHYSIEELSKSCGVSPSAFKKYFVSVFGAPVSVYLREKRMNRAKEMLGSSEANIGEIAAACGYENQSKFGAAFKAHTGTSPMEYRRLYRRSVWEEETDT